MSKSNIVPKSASSQTIFNTIRSPALFTALQKIKTDDQSKKVPQRNWEWGHLMYQAQEPSITPFPISGTAPVNSVAMSPDQKWFAAAADDKNVYVWQAGTDKPARSLNARFARIGRRIFS